MTITRPCRDCGALIARGQRCTACRRRAEPAKRAGYLERHRAYEAEHPEVVKLWGSSAWQRVRAHVRERDGGCVLRPACSGRLGVHHLVKLVDGGDPLDPAGLVTLLRPPPPLGGGRHDPA